MTRISPEKRARVYARDGGRCRGCGTTENLTVDHVIPRADGGGSHDANLQTLCEPCNSEKGSNVPAGLTRRQRRRKGRRVANFWQPLVHSPACTAGYCFVECPVFLAIHPEYADAVRPRR